MESSRQSPVSVEEKDTPAMIEPQRLGGVFVSPRRTFADIARRPTFLFPLVVAWIASMSVGFLYANRAFTQSAVEQIARTSIERGLELEGVDRQPTEAEVQDRAAAVRKVKRLWPVGTTFEIAAVVVGISVLFFLVTRLFGDRPDFRSMLSVTSWSWMAWTLLFAFPAWIRDLLSDGTSIDPTDVYSLSVIHLGHLVPADAPAFLRTVAANLSLQNLWFLALLAIGYGALTPQKTAARMAAVVFSVALGGFILRGLVGF